MFHCLSLVTSILMIVSLNIWHNNKKETKNYGKFDHRKRQILKHVKILVHLAWNGKFDMSPFTSGAWKSLLRKCIHKHIRMKFYFYSLRLCDSTQIAFDKYIDYMLNCFIFSIGSLPPLCIVIALATVVLTNANHCIQFVFILREFVLVTLIHKHNHLFIFRLSQLCVDFVRIKYTQKNKIWIAYLYSIQFHLPSSVQIMYVVLRSKAKGNINWVCKV